MTTMARRTLLGAAALFALGCRRADTPRSRRADPLERLARTGLVPEILKIGVTPSSGAHTAEFFEPLVAYLATKGLRTEVVASGDYDNLAELVAGAHVQAGVFSPLAYVKARATLPAVPVATASQSGSPTYLGYVVARLDARGEVPSLEALRGKRIAWVNRSSTSGYLYPRAMMQARGIDPDAHFATPPLFAGDHEAAIRATLEGRADAAATASAFIDPGTRSRVDGADSLGVVAKTARIPLDCVVLHEQLARDYAERLRRALLELVEDVPASQALATSWGISGFLESDERRYDEVAKVLADAQS